MTPSLRRFWAGFARLAFGTLVASLLIPAIAAAQSPAVKARTAPGTKGHALVKNVRTPSPWVSNPAVGGKDSYLSRVQAAGFDGIYLDKVDEYEWFEDKGE